MFNVNEAFIQALNKNAITDKISGNIYLTNGDVISFDDDNVKQGTLAIDNQCVNGEELEFGAVYAGQISFQIKSDISRYALFNAKIEISYFLKVNDDYVEVPMGVYWVSEPTRQGQYIKLVGYDAMTNLDDDFDNTAIMGTPFEVLSYVCEKTDTEFDNTKAEIEAMPNGKQPIQIDENSNVSSWRDCIAIVAQVLAGFGTATRTGKIKICQFSTTSSIDMPENKHDSTEIADFECSYMGLKVTTENNVYESYSEADSGLIMSIDDNILFYTGNDKGTQTKVDNVKNVLCNIIYTPSTVSMIGIPIIECGDMVTYTVKGEKYNSIITSYVWNYRSKSTYKAAGKNPRMTNAKNKADRATSSLKQSIDNSKIIFMKATNAAELSISQTDKEILKFSITSTKDTNVVFLAQMLVNVTTEKEEQIINGKVKETEIITAEDGTQTETEVEKDCYFTTQKEKLCNVNFKYFITKVEVNNFHPTEQLNEGQHILTLFYVLPDMEENSTIRFTVEMNCESGSITIPTENIKATIIGQGLNAIAKAAEWDGTFDLQEYISKFRFISPEFSFKKLNAIVESKIITPVKNEVTDTVSKFTFTPPTFEIHSLSENINSGVVVTQAVISNESAIKLQYNEEYVQVVDGVYKRIEKWEYNSNIIEVDSGTLAEVEIKTDDITVLDCEVK